MPGIYIHIPFCKQACHYCDFHFSTSLKNRDALLLALQKELLLRRDEFDGKEVHTIYFGGGTPSILKTEEIVQLLEVISLNFRVTEAPEITLEANPDDLSKEKIKQLYSAGINRLSIGVQSFFEEDLKLMNRAHSAHEAESCLVDTLELFENVSIDLIYGVPGMSEQRWRQNIEKTLDFGVPHISSYALTVEPKTALEKFIEKGVIPELDDEVSKRHFEILVAALEKEGYVHYEISNFGKPDFFSQNNTAYWQGKHYMGLGPSAHSYDGVCRAWNVRNNNIYIKSLEADKLPIESELLSVKDRYNEYIMTGLRTIWGVSLVKVRNEFGEKYAEYLKLQAQSHVSDGFLQWEKEILRATKEGKFLIDGIAADLFILNLDGK